MYIRGLYTMVAAGMCGYPHDNGGYKLDDTHPEGAHYGTKKIVSS